MLNLTISFVQTFISIVLSFVSFVRGPVALVVGVALVVFLLASPAEAAVIQCNASGCPPLGWFPAIVEDKDLRNACFFWAFAIPVMLYFIIEDMVKRKKLKKEQEKY